MSRLTRCICSILLFLSHLSGCASAPNTFDIVPAGAPAPALAEDEGLLIIHIDTDVPIQRVAFEHGVVATALPKGKFLWIVRAPARRFKWNRLELGSEAGVAQSYLIRDDDLDNENEFEFDVLPGIINYPGELIIRTHEQLRSSGHVWARNRNHSAMAIRRLNKMHKALLDAFPIQHRGWSKDGFLDFYTQERRAVAADRDGSEQ